VGSAWRCGSQSSQRGRYQLRWPSKLKMLGRMTKRISGRKPSPSTKCGNPPVIHSGPLPGR
jgi:hypothetical protein